MRSNDFAALRQECWHGAGARWRHMHLSHFAHHEHTQKSPRARSLCRVSGFSGSKVAYKKAEEALLSAHNEHLRTASLGLTMAT